MFGKVNDDSFQTLFPTLGNFARSNSNDISDSSEFSLRSPKLTSNGLARLDISLANLREEFLSSSELHNNKKNLGSVKSPPGFGIHSDFSSLLNSLDNNSKGIISPPTSPVGSLSQQGKTNTSRYKTELCRPFQETGGCKYGEKCQFAHGKDDLRSVARHPKYKTDLCRTYHSVGFCPYGPRCHFIHNFEETRSKESSQGSGQFGSQGNAGVIGRNLTNGMPPLPMFSTRDYNLDSLANSPISSSSSSSSSSDFENESEKSYSPFTSPSRLPVFSTISK